MSRDIQNEIRQEVAADQIVIYMKGTADAPQCGFSAAVIDVLRQYQKPFKEVNVLADPDKWNAVKVFSNWPTIPQIYIGGQFVGGCDIVREMHAKGELQPLVDQAFTQT